MNSRNQKPTGQGGLVANQFKAVSKHIVVWFTSDGYLSIKFADYLIQHEGLVHD